MVFDLEAVGVRGMLNESLAPQNVSFYTEGTGMAQVFLDAGKKQTLAGASQHQQTDPESPAGSEGPVRVARRYLDRQTFEELKTPLYILAANLTNGQPKLFSSGRIVPAMLASSAVPGVFPPVVLDGQVYADGGLLEWDACAEALRLGAQKIYLFACGAIGELSPRLSLPPEALENGTGKVSNGRRQITAFLAQQRNAPAIGATLLDVLERSWDVVSRFQFQRAVEGLRAGGAEVISIEPLLPMLAHPLDFSHCQMMVDAGRASAEAVFQGGVSSSAKATRNVARIA